MPLSGPGYPGVLGCAGDLHFDSPPRPFLVNLQEKLFLSLRRDEVRLPAPPRGHQEKEVQGRGPHLLGQIEDCRYVGFILAGKGVVDLKVYLAAQILNSLHGRLKASFAANQIMLLWRCAVQADADSRDAAGRNFVRRLWCEGGSIAGQRDAHAQSYPAARYLEDIGTHQGLAAAQD